jgi:hypothetical protein
MATAASTVRIDTYQRPPPLFIPLKFSIVPGRVELHLAKLQNARGRPKLLACREFQRASRLQFVPQIEGPPGRETDGPKRKTGPSRPKVFMRSQS